jgi:hypothetical protein
MADDAPAAAPASGGGLKGKVENPTTVLILGLVTCGLYTIFWLWNRAKEMNAYMGKEVVNPMFIVPGCLCFPIVIYGEFLYCKTLPEMQKKAGIVPKDEFVLHLVLMILLPYVGSYLIQQKLNEIWAK